MRAIAPMIGLLLASTGCGLVDAPGNPMVEAHRGAAGYWPQNSTRAIQGTVDADYPALEFDIVLTSDLVPVLSHDPWLHEDLCTTVDGEAIDGRQNIMDIDLDTLRNDFVCGGVADEEHTKAEVLEERIPTLAEVLQIVSTGSEEMVVHLDVKFEPDGTTFDAETMAAAILSDWYTADLSNPWFVSANQPDAIAAFELLATGEITTSLAWPRFHPDLSDATVALTEEFRMTFGQVEYVDLARDAGADGLAIPYQLIERRQVDAARAAGLQVQVWTTNTQELLDEYCAWPVDSVITDYPDDAPCLGGGK
jgi:glycerophosphoryl diester phosphodiesterase